MLRSLNKIDDFSINIMRGSIDILSSTITNNDMFLSASTSSHVYIYNTTVSDIVLSGVLIQALASEIIFINSSITNISE